METKQARKRAMGSEDAVCFVKAKCLLFQIFGKRCHVPTFEIDAVILRG